MVVVEVECFINDIDSGKKKSETRHNGIGEKGEREREREREKDLIQDRSFYDGRLQT